MKLPWTLPVWTFLDYTLHGLFVGTTNKGVAGLTATYWLVPGTGGHA